MPKYLDMHGLETLTGDIEATYLRKNKRGVANGVASLDSNGKVPTSQIPGGAGGTTDYDDLTDKPQINGTTLSGNKTSANLGIHDIPSGGTTGQVLAKSSDSNYAVQWVNQQGGGGGTTDYADLDNKPQINGTTLSGNKTTANLGIHDVPAGGTAGQVLAKVSGTDHDVGWTTPADPTQLIDDTAGSGDTNKTWSADKLSSKADTANPNFTGSISMGRAANTTVGEKSTATGTSVTASGPNSNAEGYGTTASGNSSHAEGNQTFAVGDYSHSQGYGAMANGDASSAEGNGTVANGANSSVSGMYNVPDSYANWPDWAPNTYYAAGAKVHLPDEEPDDPRGEYFVCNTPHTSGTAWITYSFYWDSDNGKMNYAQIVGNGSNYLQQSNAYTLDWDGNGSYAGDVTINKGTTEEVSVSELKTEINSTGFSVVDGKLCITYNNEEVTA